MATEQPKPEWLIHTSVQDALCTLKKIDDINILEEALSLELQRDGGRATLCKAFQSKIRLLNKRSMNGKIVDP